MPAFKSPSFQDRVAAAAKARQTALDQLKARPPVDEALLAEQRRAREAQEQALAEKRSAKALAIAEAKKQKAEAKAAELAAIEAAAALKLARPKPATPAEMKAARDARFAARKARK